MKPSVISGILILALSGVIGYKMYVKDQRIAQQVREQLRQELELDRQRSQLEGSLRVVEAYHEHLTDQREVGWLVGAIGQLAREASVHLSAINPKRPRQLEQATQLSVSLRLTTSYHELGNFISRIESSDTFFHIDELDFRQIVREDGRVEADVDLVVSTYQVSPVRIGGAS